MVVSSISLWRKEVAMLEEYFRKPSTVDRIRGSWMAAEIESFVVWSVENRYSVKSIWRRVPIVFEFGEFAGARGASAISELPAHVEAFVAERVDRAGSGLAKSTVRGSAGALRVFLRYAHRQGVLAGDLSAAVGWPQVYRLSNIPRSISWADVNRVLACVERRTEAGRRDYAILLLLVTYGLRGREVAALTLDDIDWKRERLAIPERKAGHSTAFPLSAVVGEALLDYLQHGRPETSDRQVFFRAVAPRQPIGAAAVSSLARHYLLKADVDVRLE